MVGMARSTTPALRSCRPVRLLDLEASTTLHLLQSRVVPLRGVRTPTCPDALQDDHRRVV